MSIKEIPYKIYLAESGRMFHLPHGHEKILNYYASQFPGTEEKLKHFFDLERRVYRNTPLFSLDKSTADPLLGMSFQAEDTIVLTDYLKQLDLPPELELLLFSFAIIFPGTLGGHRCLAAFLDGDSDDTRGFGAEGNPAGAAGGPENHGPSEPFQRCVSCHPLCHLV